MTVFANDSFLTGPKISHFRGFTVYVFALALDALNGILEVMLQTMFRHSITNQALILENI